MRNPKWHRDEIILALDLYFDPNRGSLDAQNPNIIALSKLLNRLPIFTDRPDEKTFRNPNGVGLKLSNFLAIDPNHAGKGMQSYSKLDKEVFNEFWEDIDRLRKIAGQIRSVTEDETIRQQLTRIEDDECTERDSVPEGQVLYRLHKYRERNRAIVNEKRRSILDATGKLICEVCEFNFHETYGEQGFGFMECHHIIPLAEIIGITNTRLQDLALVCANCHRMLHRTAGTTVEQLKYLVYRH